MVTSNYPQKHIEDDLFENGMKFHERKDGGKKIEKRRERI